MPARSTMARRCRRWPVRRLSFALLLCGGLAHAEVIGFDDAVKRALERNPSAQVAADEIARARAIVEQTRSASLPTLAATGSYTRLDGDRVLDGKVVAAADQLAASLTLAVPLVAPRAWVQWSHASRNVDVAKLSAREVQRQLAETVAHTYLSILAQRRVVEVTERARTAAEA